MRVGLRVSERSKICLFSCRWQVEITLFFHRAHPVGFVSVPAKSIPIMMFSGNSNVVTYLLIIDYYLDELIFALRV